MNEPATKGDVCKVQESVDIAHRRIDTLAHDMTKISSEVHKSTGILEVISDNVLLLTECATKVGHSQPQNNHTDKLLDVVKTLIYVVGIGGAMTAVGFYGLKTNAKHGDTEIRVEQPNQ